MRDKTPLGWILYFDENVPNVHGVKLAAAWKVDTLTRGQDCEM